MNRAVISFILLSLFISILDAKPVDCPCTLEDSTKYPDTVKWDCQNLGLVSVPGQCYELAAANVSELNLAGNAISVIHNIDFSGLDNLIELNFDTNQVEFFDPSALVGIDQIEVFQAGHNLNMEFPDIALWNKKQLKHIIFTGSNIISLPNITASTQLEWLDIRSCGITNLTRPTFGELETTGDIFVFSMIGNPIVDVAADILLPIPDFSTINVDDYLTIWAKDDSESLAVRNKQWTINIDLDTNLKTCGSDGSPADLSMC